MPILKSQLTSMHAEVLAQLKSQKANNPRYRVLDVGGTAMPWANEIVPDYLDIQSHATIVGDACLPETWESVGQYDFSICTHTLEDLRDPLMVIRQLVKHSKAGFIGVPHKHTELGLMEWKNIVGYCHHRWVFTIQNNKLRILAKWGVVHQFALGADPGPGYLPWLRRELIHVGELDFTWEKNFDVEYIQSDFSGPDPTTGCDGLLNFYRDELADGL